MTAAATSSPVVTTSRLAALRALMRERNLQAYIIPSEDAHQSEYIAPCLAVVSLDGAGMWTDGRYYLQASQQMDSNWTLQKMGMPGVPTKEEWLLQTLAPGSRVGVDSKLITVAAAKLLVDSLAEANISLVSIPDNLVDIVWDAERPPVPSKPIFLLPEKYAGKSAKQKIEELRAGITKKGNVWGFVVSLLDEIAWLFNLRGADIDYNPVFFSYALITKTEAILYIDPAKLTPEVSQALKDNGVTTRAYEAIFTDLKAYDDKAVTASKKEKLWIDSRCSLALQEAVSASRVEISRSPIAMTKCIKNATEIQGFRNCHIRDATALCEYFAWLEEQLVVKKNRSISEVDAADVLEGYRKKLADFVGLSFDTISSTGPNGSIIHYKPVKETCRLIDPDAIYLCDSGAQYMDGTTDVTRTLHFGTPTEFEKEAFTRVLKGHIQLDMTVFPRGITGYILDVLSRTALWKGGLDFRHGTGHGVGSFLCVHEGPHGIGTRIHFNDIPLEAGMTITNEPGFYDEDCKFGIRIENVMIIKDVETSNNFGGRGYLGFEHVTLVPIQTSLINKDLMTAEEIKWLNDYHKEVFEKLSPLLEKGSRAYKWLEKETRAI
ncbi:hypothetical protein HDV05_005600 [Chytridiales sp. JEL 0842]|nr:hypothetical protein HDV05_005600 [Chytridiales sp. JEL 0842]